MPPCSRKLDRRSGRPARSGRIALAAKADPVGVQPVRVGRLEVLPPASVVGSSCVTPVILVRDGCVVGDCGARDRRWCSLLSAFRSFGLTITTEQSGALQPTSRSHFRRSRNRPRACLMPGSRTPRRRGSWPSRRSRHRSSASPSSEFAEECRPPDDHRESVTSSKIKGGCGEAAVSPSNCGSLRIDTQPMRFRRRRRRNRIALRTTPVSRGGQYSLSHLPALSACTTVLRTVCGQGDVPTAALARPDPVN